MWRRFLMTGVLGLTVTWASPVDAATLFDPNTRWFTITTPHFRVNYPDGCEALAKLAARYAEDAHTLLAPYLDSVPEQLTEVTILDNEDTVNGFGFPYPNNQMYIYATSPNAEMLMGRYDHWLRDLILHEYTHVLHMEKTAGLPAWLNRFLGRTYFPNVLQPIFLIEGLAVMTETRFSNGGRGRDTAYRTVLRMAALSDRLARLDQASGYYTIDHPGGEIPYIYGSAFYRHLQRHFGEQVPVELANRYSHYPFFGLYGTDDVLKTLTGRNTRQLWEAMCQELKVEATTEAHAIAAQGPLTPLKPVTDEGMLHRHPHWWPDGSLGYAAWDGHDFARVWRVKPGDRPAAVIGKSPYGRFEVSRDGTQILHGRQWDENRFTGYNDVFRFDIKQRRLVRLSVRQRVDEPTMSPDGRWVVAVQNGAGQSNLVKFALKDGKRWKPLTTLQDQTQFSAPTWHPTQSVVAVSAWRDGARDLYLVDTDTGRLKALWRDRDNDLAPCWSPDGRYLVFSSDRDGVFNLYAYEMTSERLFRITNVLGGLLDPAISADGKTIAASSYSAKGYDIVTFPWNPEQWVPVSRPNGPEPRAVAPIHDDKDFKQASYNPWPSLRPKVWAPFAFLDDRGPVLGSTTYGQDSLVKHLVFGAVGWGVFSGRPFYSLSYVNDEWYPSLSAFASETTLVTNPVFDGVGHRLVTQGLYQGLGITWPGLPSAFLQNSWVTGDTLGVGLNFARLTPLETPPQVLPQAKKPSYGQTNTVSVTYRFGDNYKFARSISPEGGNLVTLAYEQAFQALGSEYQFQRVWADWRRYVPLPWLHHVLALRLSGGATWGETDGVYQLGGFDSATLLANVDLRTASGIGARQLPLRGYPFGVASGPRGATLSAEYRFPLVALQQGYGILPFFLRQLHGAFFVDGGTIWGDAQLRGPLVGVGAELRAQTHVLQAPTEVRLGIGQPAVDVGDRNRWPNVFVDIGSYF
jgi:Tol biopolymer transport system component